MLRVRLAKSLGSMGEAVDRRLAGCLGAFSLKVRNPDGHASRAFLALLTIEVLGALTFVIVILVRTDHAASFLASWWLAAGFLALLYALTLSVVEGYCRARKIVPKEDGRVLLAKICCEYGLLVLLGMAAMSTSATRHGGDAAFLVGVLCLYATYACACVCLWMSWVVWKSFGAPDHGLSQALATREPKARTRLALLRAGQGLCALCAMISIFATPFGLRTTSGRWGVTLGVLTLPYAVTTCVLLLWEGRVRRLRVQNVDVTGMAVKAVGSIKFILPVDFCICIVSGLCAQYLAQSRKGPAATSSAFFLHVLFIISSMALFCEFLALSAELEEQDRGQKPAPSQVPPSSSSPGDAESPVVPGVLQGTKTGPAAEELEHN